MRLPVRLVVAGMSLLSVSALGCSRNNPSQTTSAAKPQQPPENSTPTSSTAKSGFDSNPLQSSSNESFADSEDVLRRFLLAMFTLDENGVRATILANPDAAILWQGEGVPAEHKSEMQSFFSSLAFQHLKVGDEVRIPGGNTLVLDKTYVNESRQQITISGEPIPFILVKDAGAWKVDASPVIAARKAAAAARTKANTGPTPSLFPDPSLLDKLGPEVAMMGWKIRPPAGYKLDEQGVPPIKMFTWTGPVRKDETSPAMIIILGPAGPAEKSAGLEALLDESVAQIKKRRDHWSSSPVDYVRIGATDLIRVSWSGVCTVGKKALVGKPMQGQVFLARDADTVVVIMLEDVEPYHKESLPIGKAAAMTLRKLSDPTPIAMPIGTQDLFIPK